MAWRWAHEPFACATCGMIISEPNSRNVIPGKVFLTVDFRHPDDAKLASMETDETLRSHYRAGLALNARNALVSLDAYKTFDNNDAKVFGNADWRAVFTTWFPQPTQADAEKLSKTGDNAKRGERKYYEQRFMQNPLAAAAIVALEGDSTRRAVIEQALNHYDYTKLHMATFFFAECAAYAMPPAGAK